MNEHREVTNEMCALTCARVSHGGGRGLFFGMWSHDNNHGMQVDGEGRGDGGPVEFMVTDIHPTDVAFKGFDAYRSNEQKVIKLDASENRYSSACTVYVFGVTSKGRTVSCRVSGFRPMLRFLCSRKVGRVVLKEMSAAVRDNTLEKRVKWVQRHRSDGFYVDEEGERKEFEFMEVSFDTIRAYNIASRGTFAGVTCTTRKRSPLIQFTIRSGIRPSHWCTVSTYSVSGQRCTHSTVEIETRLASVSYVERDEVAPIIIASVDIETYTPSKRSNRCNPDSPDDRIFMIGTTFYRVGDPKEKTLSVVQCVGCCAPVEGVTILTYDTEAKLLDAWRNLVVVDVPVTAFVGYNVVTFDYPYMARRAELCGAPNFMYLSRLINHKVQLDKVRMETQAQGKNELCLFGTVGSFHIDIWHWIKTNKKYESNSLNAVSGIVLGSQKVDLPYQKMFGNVESGDPLKMAECAKYNEMDCVLPLKLMHALDILTTMIGMSRVTFTGIMHLVSRGQQFKVFNQICWGCERRGFEPIETEAMGNKFEGAFVVDPMKGFYKEPLAVLDFASLYPSIMMAYNLCMSTRLLGPSVPKTLKVEERTIEFTAFLHSASQPVSLDSLSPLNRPAGDVPIIWVTLDGATRLCKLDAASKQPKKKDWTSDYVVVVKYTGERFRNMCTRKNAFVQGTKSILPDILKELLDARKRTRKQMQDVKDPAMLDVLNGRQLALKISANSVYGFTGVREGMLPCQEIAETVTNIARDSIHLVIQKVSSFEPCDVVYGDTDSVMLRFHKKYSVSECMEVGNRLGPWLTQFFPPPMKLEMEKVYENFLINGKKRYAGNMYVLDKHDNVVFEKLDAKGMETVRRGQAPFCKRVQQEVLDIVMSDCDISKITAVVKCAMQKLVDRSVSVDDLVMSRSLGDDYKNPETVIQHEVVRKIRERNEDAIPVIGDRVAYVITKGDGRLMASKGEDPEFVKRSGARIDWLNYAERQLCKPIQSLLEQIVDIRPVFFQYLETLRRLDMNRNGSVQDELGGGIVKVLEHAETIPDKPCKKPKREQRTLF
jgi:DNA polymerase delta subunit 1